MVRPLNLDRCRRIVVYLVRLQVADSIDFKKSVVSTVMLEGSVLQFHIHKCQEKSSRSCSSELFLAKIELIRANQATAVNRD